MRQHEVYVVIVFGGCSSWLLGGFCFVYVVGSGGKVRSRLGRHDLFPCAGQPLAVNVGSSVGTKDDKA